LQKHGEDVSAYVNDYSKEIKREALSKYSFEHPKFLKELGAGLGRHILWEIVKQIFSNYAAKKKLILIDAPTLFETKILAHICFPIIVVGIDEAVQVERLVKTRNMTEDEAKLRIGSQMPLSLKKKLADVYVDNNGTPEEMFGKTLKFVNKIL
jgi:dephospho-CoA kinase